MLPSQKTLGIYLLWRNPSENLHVSLDVSFTLLNRECYSESRSLSLPRSSFRQGFASSGVGSFIKIADLLTHRPRFVDANGEFQVELRLSRPDTYFERDFFFPRGAAEAVKKADQQASNNSSPSAHGDPLAQVSAPFQFGCFSLVVTARPNLLGTWRQDAAGIAVTVGRKFRSNSQSLLCRVKFVCSAGVGDKRCESDLRDETLGPQVNKLILYCFSFKNLFYRM